MNKQIAYTVSEWNGYNSSALNEQEIPPYPDVVDFKPTIYIILATLTVVFLF